MRVDRGCVHEADKESIDELEGRKWTGGLYTIGVEDRGRAIADKQSLGSNRNTTIIQRIRFPDIASAVVSFLVVGLSDGP